MSHYYHKTRYFCPGRKIFPLSPGHSIATEKL